MSPARRKPAEGDNLIDFDPAALRADPAVRALIGQEERLKQEARLSRRQREKVIKERRKIRERREQHTCYDIPPQLRQYIKTLAEELRLPASQIAALALLRFARDWQAGTIDLAPYKRPSRSPKYDWNLELDPAEWGV
ncbi:MAG: hypothetical protein HPY45_17375 [Anaerolineae bacterium]|nr:hypothetical protein [Anaerolineae bacterium]